MTKKEAKKQVIILHNSKYLNETDGLDKQDSAMGALPFFIWLQKNHPNVLNFSSTGDKYQIVKTWVK